jgi:hypothetical protein
VTALAVALALFVAAGIKHRHPPYPSMLEILACWIMRLFVLIGALAMAFASAMTQAVQTFPSSVKWHYDLYSRKEAK